MSKIVGDLKARLGLDKTKFDKGIDEAEKRGNKFGSAMKKLGGILAGAFAFHKIAQGITKFIQKNTEFGQSLANLSAITGAVGKDLDYYSQQAKKIGRTTTLSASQAVKAFELMGSARPELLKNKEALAAVTEQAVILAEASGLELTEATNALAKSMNQFNIPAGKAADVINILAAGSKAGAEAIPGLAEGIKWMGTSASMANISLEQSVALIETLAEKGLSGAESGAQLRNVILKLQSGAEDTNPAIVGMSTALENLNKKNLSAAKLTEMFGLRNQQAAAILIQNVDKFKSYTEAVTGTNIAYEQQAKKVDTVQGRWKGLMSVIEGITLQGEGFNNTIKEGLVWMTNKIPEVAKVFNSIKGAIVSVINYFIDLYNESTAFRGIIEGIKFTFRTVFDYIKMQIRTVVSAFTGLGKILKDVFTGNWKEIKVHAKEAFDAIGEDIEDFGEDVAENWQQMMKNMTEKKHVQLIEIKAIRTSGGGSATGGGGVGGTAVAPPGLEAKFSERGLMIGEGEDELAGIYADIEEELKGVHEEFTAASLAAAEFGNQVMLAGIQGEGSLIKFGKTVVSVAKQIISAYVAEAVAGAVKSALVEVPFPFNIVAAGVAGGLAAAAINAAIPSFASGGVIPGGYPNDTYPALLTSGERVLTPLQNSQYESGSGSVARIAVDDIKIKGTDMYLIMKEVERRRRNSF